MIRSAVDHGSVTLRVMTSAVTLGSPWSLLSVASTLPKLAFGEAATTIASKGSSRLSMIFSGSSDLSGGRLTC